MFTLIDPQTIWVLAYIDESKAGEISVGEPVEIVLRSHPNDRLQGGSLGSSRRATVSTKSAGSRSHSTRSRTMSTSANRPRSTSRPSTCRSRCWFGGGDDAGLPSTAERYGPSRTGAATARVTLGQRLLDGRYEITGGVPDEAAGRDADRQRLRVGRAATDRPEASAMNSPYRDIKHNLLRFVLTNFGLSLLLGIVIVNHRCLSRADRRCAAAGSCGERRPLGGPSWHQWTVRRGFADPRRYAGTGQPGSTACSAPASVTYQIGAD